MTKQEEIENPFTEVIARINKENPPKPNYRGLAFQWLNMGKEERIACHLPTNQIDFAYSIGIGTTKMKGYKKEFFSLNMKDKIDSAKEKMTEDEEDFDPKKWFNETKKERYEYALRAAKNGNAQAMRLLAQLAEELVEKQEVRIGFTADEIARRNLEADRQLREAGY